MTHDELENCALRQLLVKQARTFYRRFAVLLSVMMLLLVAQVFITLRQRQANADIEALYNEALLTAAGMSELRKFTNDVRHNHQLMLEALKVGK